MDLLSDVLATLRLEAKVVLHSLFCERWTIDVSGLEENASFHVIADGECWLHREHEAPLRLSKQDLVVVPRNAPHLITESVEPPDLEAPRNVALDSGSGPSVSVICGSFSFAQNYWNPLLESLPDFVIIPAERHAGTTLGVAINEIIRECASAGNGSDAVIDRFADIIVIEVLRGHVRYAPGGAYVAALRDQKVGQALQLFHQDPGRDWSVQRLADSVHMSRSAFAERFPPACRRGAHALRRSLADGTCTVNAGGDKYCSRGGGGCLRL